ncbi:MAG TPA: nitrate ABC transporter ATP-binding protein [Deltaproteobacteria bacterium]|nr:MAG: ABC transporter ATP-binding protein [Pseudomonadota bacterium]HBM53430.1 nitrate ABC transporter ATP-binding protein [Deltaproteobacteria bacterium]
MTHFVDIDEVSVSYNLGEPPVLEGASLQMSKGEFVALVGPSGCGKSTFMKLMSGLLKADQGSVVVANQEVTRPLGNVGMAFQNSVMLPWRTTLNNLLLPLEIARPHRETFRQNREAHANKAIELLSSVGLENVAEKFPWELSGGMRQRASLCRALIHEPEVLMLDEPFGALDAFTREELWCVLRDLWQERKFTVLLVTHDLIESAFLADRVLVMSNRPSRVIMELEIPFKRPRDLDIRFEKEFVDIVHQLRDQIRTARAA